MDPALPHGINGSNEAPSTHPQSCGLWHGFLPPLIFPMFFFIPSITAHASFPLDGTPFADKGLAGSWTQIQQCFKSLKLDTPVSSLYHNDSANCWKLTGSGIFVGEIINKTLACSHWTLKLIMRRGTVTANSEAVWCRSIGPP